MFVDDILNALNQKEDIQYEIFPEQLPAMNCQSKSKNQSQNHAAFIIHSLPSKLSSENFSYCTNFQIKTLKISSSQEI